jgi:hypothetical protein
MKERLPVAFRHRELARRVQVIDVHFERRTVNHRCDRRRPIGRLQVDVLRLARAISNVPR